MKVKVCFSEVILSLHVFVDFLETNASSALKCPVYIHFESFLVILFTMFMINIRYL